MLPLKRPNLLLAPVMPAFMDRYPDIEIDIVASNRMVDVTDAGFDAGIRYGGTVPEDMVARRLSADIRWVIAASPDYLERYGTPEHPDDLLHHRCISNRLGDDRIYRWELERDGETYQITVPGSVTVNQAETGLVAVLGGAGLMYFPEPLVAPYEGWTAPPGAYGMVPAGGRFLYLLFKPPATADRASPSD
jgi:DNA-binding transcriptional LysR family regulator